MKTREEREKILNMYFHEGLGYKRIAKITGVSVDTIKSMCRRYRKQNNLQTRGKIPLSKEPITSDTIRINKKHDDNTQDERIARLEMEVELLRNFLILTAEK